MKIHSNQNIVVELEFNMTIYREEFGMTIYREEFDMTIHREVSQQCCQRRF